MRRFLIGTALAALGFMGASVASAQEITIATVGPMTGAVRRMVTTFPVRRAKRLASASASTLSAKKGSSSGARRGWRSDKKFGFVG